MTGEGRVARVGQHVEDRDELGPDRHDQDGVDDGPQDGRVGKRDGIVPPVPAGGTEEMNI